MAVRASRGDRGETRVSGSTWSRCSQDVESERFMSANDLQEIAQAVISQARQQGYVLPREIREQLAQAGIPETRWKELVAQVEQLNYRKGRYYYVSPMAARLQQKKRNQQAIQRVVRQLLRDHKKKIAQQLERRQQPRSPFVRSVIVQTADQRDLRMFSCDLSDSGIRLIGTCNLQGQKVRLLIPGDAAGTPPRCFLLHVLWASASGDDMFENGGIFVDVISP
jgi:hypothetical protein